MIGVLFFIPFRKSTQVPKIFLSEIFKQFQGDSNDLAFSIVCVINKDQNEMKTLKTKSKIEFLTCFRMICFFCFFLLIKMFLNDA